MSVPDDIVAFVEAGEKHAVEVDGPNPVVDFLQTDMVLLQHAVRRRASRPAEHSFLTTDCVVVFTWRRAARRSCQPPLATPRRPNGRASGVQRRVPRSKRGVDETGSSTNRQQASRGRGALEHTGQGAPSKKRLELAAPRRQSRIPFMRNNPGRRSSSAVR